jgi:periplasmic protein TonB
VSPRNSTFGGHSILELDPPPSVATRYPIDAPPTLRPAAPRPRPPVSRAPEVWGQFNNYRADGVAVSAIVHAVFIGLLVASAGFGRQIVQPVAPREIVTLIAPSPDSYALPVSKKVISGGGGGGGDHDALPALKGRFPKPAIEQITAPAIVVRNEAPRLTAEPTVVIPPTVHLADNRMPNLGSSTGARMPAAPPSNGTGSGGGIGSGSGGGVEVVIPPTVHLADNRMPNLGSLTGARMPAAPPSNGTGSGGGIGSGSGGGVGEGRGPGVGSGSGGGVGGIFRVGGGVSAPQALSTPTPNYTEEARRAKTQGTCILGLIVDTEGHPRDIRVVRGLGSGLDAKAIEAVERWRFEPAKKDGKPVNVLISVEVSFRLY